MENVESAQLYHLLTLGIVFFLHLYLYYFKRYRLLFAFILVLFQKILLLILYLAIRKFSCLKHRFWYARASFFVKEILASYCSLFTGKGLPDVNSVIKHFKDAFDWVEANNSGRIIPHEGVDIEYDSACEKVKEIESHLTKHLQEQRKLLGDKSVRTSMEGKLAF